HRRLNGHGHVVGLVVYHTIQPVERQRQPVDSGGRAEAHLRSPAPHHERPPVRARQSHQRRQFLDAPRLRRRIRRYAPDALLPPPPAPLPVVPPHAFAQQVQFGVGHSPPLTPCPLPFTLAVTASPSPLQRDRPPLLHRHLDAALARGEDFARV